MLMNEQTPQMILTGLRNMNSDMQVEFVFILFYQKSQITRRLLMIPKMFHSVLKA